MHEGCVGVACQVGQIIKWLEDLAPSGLAESWDRVGLQIGDPNGKARRILVALTLTLGVADQAIARGIDLIVVHHPPLFRPAGDIRWDRPEGALLRRIIANGISVYASHTNFDVASEGTNEVLAKQLGLQDYRPLVPHPNGVANEGMGRIGQLREAMDPEAFLALVYKRLQVPSVRCCGPIPERIQRVAVMGGSGASLLRAADEAGADAFITGDVDFHEAIESDDLGLWTIDAGHFATERWVVPFWQEYLQEQAKAENLSLEVEAAVEHDPFLFRQDPTR